MTLGAAVRRAVRERAGFGCEYCGVSEADTGGELTIDHYRPRSAGGDDGIENLLYCCARCNLYKADYWPSGSDAPTLWNPRHEPITAHVIELPDASLYPLTATGAFTIRRLRLNRPPLVAHRRRKQDEASTQRLLARYREIVAVSDQLYREQIALLDEQRALLVEQRALLRLLAGRQVADEGQAGGGGGSLPGGTGESRR